MARVYCNLAELSRRQGMLDQAETLQRRTLALHEQLEDFHGLAMNYGSLASIYEARQDHATASSCWGRASELCKQAGMPDRALEMLQHTGELGCELQDSTPALK
ncbi:MAG: tetratricopeptide repeat protein [Acidobacteriota bacterium]|nr:tetratricopeptide repeat protein [Acidobacteriota bacterium]